jgi:uncharacterized protein YqgC (DUF456 family)
MEKGNGKYANMGRTTGVLVGKYTELPPRKDAKLQDETQKP